MPKTLTAADLKQFTGSAEFYKHWIAKNIIYTEGAAYLAKQAGAHWLLDEIAFNQTATGIRGQHFQVWDLTINAEKSSAWLVCQDGNGNKLWEKYIAFTDFPLPHVQLWLSHHTIMLPSEY